MEDPLSIILSTHIIFYPITSTTVIGLIVLLILLIISALISGSEVAYFSLTPQKIEQLENDKTRKAQLVIKLINKAEKLLATILIVNNLVNIGIVILSTFIIDYIVHFNNMPIIKFVVEIVIITFVILLFGEIIPKVYASRFPVGFASFMARPLNFCTKLFYPISFLMLTISDVIKKKIHKKKQQVSIDELSQALDLTKDETIQEDKILKGIINFGTIGASEIMKPRMDIISIDITFDFTKVFQIINNSGYSRIPVFSESIDNIKGILYIKDLLPHLKKNKTFRWQSLIRPPFFIPESKKIDDLLKEFQTKKIHMAIVVDEYGGASGIITMEDILEEIVGEINDEFDNIEKNYKQLSKNKFLFEGKTTIIDFCKKFEIDDNYFDKIKGEADSLAGMILEIKGDLPDKKECFVYKNFSFNINDVDDRRIKQIQVTIDPNYKEKSNENK